MRETQNFGRFNELAIWLPLALCVRKMELLSAKWSEFDLEKGIWKLQPGPPQTFRSANLGGIAPSRDEIIAAI